MNEYVKNLGQVAALVISTKQPKVNYVLWYDLNTEIIKYYNKSTGEWKPFSEALADAENLNGDGEGLIFKETENSILKFRRIKGENGISVSTETNDVVISLSDYMEPSPAQLNFDSTLGSINKLRIPSNVSWVLVIPTDLINEVTGWLSFDKTSGYGYSEITLTVTNPNPSETQRSETILVRDSSGVLEDKEVIVTQVGTSTLVGKYIQTSDFQCEIV